ncbi:MAG: nucleotide exchange factor GrpE [Candidatus Micrarchaeota archaeon]
MSEKENSNSSNSNGNSTKHDMSSSAEDIKKIAHKTVNKIEHKQQKEIAAESKESLEQNLIRLQAEFENYRKRTVKELEIRADIGKMEFAKSQIQFFDELENALLHTDGEAKKGISMLIGNFKKSLALHDVREMDCIGQKSDPYMHDIVSQQDSEKPEGTIIEVVRKGYFYKDKILRHAQVIISKKLEKSEGKLEEKLEELEEKNENKKGG